MSGNNKKFIFSGLFLLGAMSMVAFQNFDLGEITPLATGDTTESFKAPNGTTVTIHITAPVGTGVYSRAIASGETVDAYFANVLAETIAIGSHKLVIPKGVYNFQGDPKCNPNAYYTCSPHWQIGNYPSGPPPTSNTITDLEIDLSGSTLNFNSPNVGINILNTARIRLENFTIDWPTLPIASLGKIIVDPYNPKHKALLIDAKYPVTSKFGAVQIQAVDPWEAITDTSDPAYPGRFALTSDYRQETYFTGIDPNTNKISAPPTYEGAYEGGSLFSCKGCDFSAGGSNFDIFPLQNERVIVRHYISNGRAIYVNWSSDIDIENVTILTGPGNGIDVDTNGGFHDLRVYNSSITRGPLHLISTAAGGIDFNQTQGDVLIENNTIAFQGDDAIAASPGNSTIAPGTFSKTATDTLIGFQANCDISPKDDTQVGDILNFYDQDYLYLDQATVTALGPCSNSNTTITLSGSHTRLAAAFYFVDKNILSAANYIIRNNTLSNNRGHGLITNSSYGLIDSNTFSYNSMGAVSISNGNSNPGPNQIILSNNSMSWQGDGARTSGVLSVIMYDSYNLYGKGQVVPYPEVEGYILKNNTVKNPQGPALVVTSTSSFSISATTISNGNTMANICAASLYGPIPCTDSLIVYGSKTGSICGTAMTSSGPIGVDSANDVGVTVSPTCVAPTSCIGGGPVVAENACPL